MRLTSEGLVREIVVPFVGNPMKAKTVRSSKPDRREAARLAHMLRIERELHAEGYTYVAGIDEAGRGPLAGPVCAGIVVFEPGARIPGVDDSKAVNAELRDELYERIVTKAVGWATGLASAEEIDELNILNATKLAVRRAIRKLLFIPDYLLIDALKLEDCSIPQQGIIDGDAKCFSIAAASILAKVTRDRLMVRYHGEFPQYAFDQHKGYATELHWERILEHGISSLHRRSFFDPGFLAPAMKMSARYQKFCERIEAASSREHLHATMTEAKQLAGFLPVTEMAALSELARARLASFRAEPPR